MTMFEFGRGDTVRHVAKVKRSRSRWLVTGSVTLIALVINLPLFNAIYVSLKSNADIARGALSIPTGLSFEHYTTLFTGSAYDFQKYLANSVMIAIGTVGIVLLLGVPAAYGASRLGFAPRTFINSAAAIRFLPAIVFVVPFFSFFSVLRLTDSISGLVIVNSFLNLPLAIILLMASLNEIPKEVEEAAAVDGAGVFTTMYKVVLPLLAPTLVSLSVLVFIFSWNEFLFALVLSSSNATPVVLGASNFITSTGIRWGEISAATILGAVPPLLFAIFAQRFLVSGLSMGAVKGG